MKFTIRSSIGFFLTVALLSVACNGRAQSVVETRTTTSEGVISEFGPQSLIISSQAGAAPLRYSSSDTTQYVDADGQPVAVGTMKSGIPVTVYYTTVGDALVVSKVVVRKVSVTPVPVQDTTETITTSDGTISEFSPKGIVIKTTSSPDPLRYSYGSSTTYVDETGMPVSEKMIRQGTPVTVYYIRDGKGFIASKVVVKQSVPDPAPLIEQKRTTTTTEK